MSGLVEQIEGGTIAPIYVLYGEEPAPIRTVIEALRDAILDPATEAFNHERFDGREVDGIGRVLEACAQLPMMGPHRLVELVDVDQIGKGRGGTGKDSPARLAMDALTAYAAQPNPTTVLLVTGTGVDGRSKLTKAARKTGVAHKFEALKRDGDAVGFLLSHADREQIGVDRQAARAIVTSVGTARAQLTEALDRASLHAGAGKTVTVEDVEAVVSHTREAVIFELTDAVGLGDRERALRSLSQVFERATSEIGQANMVLAMLIRQIRLVFTASFASGSIEEAAGVPPFVARKLRSQASRFDEARLRATYAGLARLDRDLKGGSPVAMRAPRLALERWILDVCGGLPGVDQRT